MVLTGITGHKTHTIWRIRATIPLEHRRIRHTIYVVKDDFPIEYEGILGIDFLQKQKAKCDLGKRQLRIGDEIFKLRPYTTVILKPRSETVVRAITNTQYVEVINSEEIMPGVFIGNCLVKPEEGTCPISVINTTEEQVAISTPLVSIEEIPETVLDNADKPLLQMTQCEDKKPPQVRKEQLKNLIRTEHLNEEEKKALEQICEEFCDTFYLEDDVLTCTSTVSHEINTRTDSAPMNVRPYRLPEKHKKEINRQIKQMLSEGIIRPRTSQWNAPILVVSEKSDASGKQKLRIVVDFRKLNDLTIGDSYPLPNITDILDQLGSAKYFSTLDLASGCHQIAMSEKDKSVLHIVWTLRVQSYAIRPEERAGNRASIVIYGASLQEHNKRLTEVLKRLREHNLKLQIEYKCEYKCEFLRKEVTYLGHIISENGILPDPSKLSAVKNFPTPKKVKDVQSFIGLAGYYRKFKKDFSKIAKPLMILTKKDNIRNLNRPRSNKEDSIF